MCLRTRANVGAQNGEVAAFQVLGFRCRHRTDDIAQVLQDADHDLRHRGGGSVFGGEGDENLLLLIHALRLSSMCLTARYGCR